MTYRLLHLSDLHLERSFAAMGCQGELARRRRQGLRHALQGAGEAAQQHQCDAITIGGDLYEHDRASADTASFLSKLFASWQPIPVLIAPGNHDPLMRGSLYASTEWPENVHIFTTTELHPVALEDGLTLWGLAHQEPAWQGDPLDTPINKEGTNIALFHGAEIGSRPEGKSVHGPFRATSIREKGFSLALCGHYHARRMDKQNRLLYPGTPEPLAFDEEGSRGPVVVDIHENGDVEFAPLATNRWSAISADCDLTGTSNVSEAMESVISCAIANTTGVDPTQTLLRIELWGDVATSLSIDAYSLESAIREDTGIAVARIHDGTKTELDMELIASEATVRGAFARSLQQELEDAEDSDKAAIEDALRYGLEALSGNEVGLR